MIGVTVSTLQNWEQDGVRRRDRRERFSSWPGFGVAPDASPQAVPTLLGRLLDCPDCRAAVLEPSNADDRKNVDMDEVIRDLAQSRHH